jgi:hypothetical protein
MPSVDDRHLVGSGGNPRVQPCGFRKGRICTVVTTQPDQRQTEQVVGSAVLWVGIEGRQPCDSGLQVLQRLVETSLLITSGCECGVSPRVSRVPCQSLPPVRLRRTSGVPVLLEVAADQIELLDGTDLARLRRLTSGLDSRRPFDVSCAGRVRSLPIEQEPGSLTERDRDRGCTVDHHLRASLGP